MRKLDWVLGEDMRYFSVCSGIEAATVAWHHLGWKPIGFSEIEPFPSAVLANHYPTVKNYGDLTKHAEWEIKAGAVDVLVGGTPCQSFSIAGLRKGLSDPRGNLALVFLALADRLKPRWIVWENVPGVLSSNGGRDFGSFVGALVELGYGFAYRVLDAQYFGVPQRRRRVFVVGCAGGWERAAEVLFERESLLRDLAAGGKARKRAPSDAAPGARVGRGKRRATRESVGSEIVLDGQVVGALTTGSGTKLGAPEVDAGHYLVAPFAPSTETPQPIVLSSGQANAEISTDGTASTLTCLHEAPVTVYCAPIAGTLAAVDGPKEGADASEDGTGRGTPIVSQPYTLEVRGREGERVLEYRQDGTANCLRTSNGGRDGMGVGAVAFQLNGDRKNLGVSVSENAFCLPANPMSDRAQAVVQPLAFAQNNREEVRLCNGDGAITGALNAQGGSHQTTYIAQPLAFDSTQVTSPANRSNPRPGDPCHPLAAGAHAPAVAFHPAQDPISSVGIAHSTNAPVAMRESGQGYWVEDKVAGTLDAHMGASGHENRPAVVKPSTSMVVRRLTPMECERLQGFPDGYTAIPWKNKPASECPDGPRYRALGNSMAVPVMRWIGERIWDVERGEKKK